MEFPEPIRTALTSSQSILEQFPNTEGAPLALGFIKASLALMDSLESTTPSQRDLVLGYLKLGE